MINRILKLIEFKGITASKLTSDLKLSNSAITDWKKGKGKPSAEAITKIARYFNVTTDYLLGLTDSPMPLSTLSPEDMAALEVGRKINKLPPDKQKIVDILLNDNK